MKKQNIRYGLNPFKTENAAALNWYRRNHGLVPMVQRTRQCLNCDEIFQSDNQFNRLCKQCGERHEAIEPVRLFVASADM